jgi:metallo-beta-lactamase class B
MWGAMLDRCYKRASGSLRHFARTTSARGFCLVALVATLGCGPAQSPFSREVQTDIANAKATARGDLDGYLNLCPTPKGPVDKLKEDISLVGQVLTVRLGDPEPVHPQKIFDNLYFLGTDFVSSWAIKTSQGLILLDTLNNDADGRQIEAALRKLGLDPSDIKYMVIGHGHADHYGGATYLKAKYGAHIVMSAVDWRELQTKSGFDVDHWVWGRSRPPKRDIAVREGNALRLGDTVLSFYLTPGHTPGSISVIFPVKDGNATYNAMFWGGTNFESARTAADLRKVAARIDQMRIIARKRRVFVHISNHNRYDRSLDKVMRMQAPGYAGTNPFLLEPETVDRSLSVMAQCARAAAANASK